MRWFILIQIFMLGSHCLAGGPVKPGAESTEAYFPSLKGKRVGIVANQTSMVDGKHLIDTLLASGIQIQRIFSPEHGFRGQAEAGEKIGSATDPVSGIEIYSLYGKTRKPDISALKDIDMMVFDIQDVGVRFYTYISTLQYIMESCAQSGVPLLILDRPNPNGFYVDGPVLKPELKSFVGMHPVPLVHGMTVGEFARMIQGEGWLGEGRNCNVTVIQCENYNHKTRVRLTVKPSPNLPNMAAIYLYPTIGLFEGTIISEGRGTDYPFQCYGHPDYKPGNFQFTPVGRPGAAKNPKFKDQVCRGELLKYLEDSIAEEGKIRLKYLIETHYYFKYETGFFTNFFDKLAGTSELREQLLAGKSEEEIRKTWKPQLESFMKIREKYLLYPDF
jgi:uncharacterized protein YbbC (DUF1343 family)